MDDSKTQWRLAKPDYTMVNEKYMKEKQNNHAAGSPEKMVEDFVKTWEMELAHKVREEVSQYSLCPCGDSRGGIIFCCPSVCPSVAPKTFV